MRRPDRSRTRIRCPGRSGFGCAVQIEAGLGCTVQVEAGLGFAFQIEAGLRCAFQIEAGFGRLSAHFRLGGFNHVVEFPIAFAIGIELLFWRRFSLGIRIHSVWNFGRERVVGEIVGVLQVARLGRNDHKVVIAFRAAQTRAARRDLGVVQLILGVAVIAADKHGDRPLPISAAQIEPPRLCLGGFPDSGPFRSFRRRTGPA